MYTTASSGASLPGSMPITLREDFSLVVLLRSSVIVAFIAYKVLMGLVRVGVIILILAVLAGMWSQGMIG